MHAVKSFSGGIDMHVDKSFIRSKNYVNNQQKNYTDQLLENLQNIQYIHHLRTTFGGADSISPTREIGFLLCVIDNYNKYAWVVPLKDTKDITIKFAFKKR